VSIPEHIGPYRIVEVIGEGGMGVVYLAEQLAPIRRNVALKLIKKHDEDGRLRMRFEAERRALERVDHPNVARVFDAGTTEDGTPFIAMEFVPGVGLNRFCEDNNVRIRDRLQLFVGVCRGVQHVHQKGLIHRDLKPSNLLVMDRDGERIPMIIDFGIAKGADTPLTDDTITAGGMVGTPMYVAPETLRGEGIDTRSDIYALGMVLHRLLIGVGPIQKEPGLNLLTVIQRLAAGEVSLPSARLDQLDGDALLGVARRRQTSPRQLKSSLQRDLDWVVSRAINPDPEHRYATAEEFATDIERFLAGNPVAARPPTALYRLQKMAARNRLAVAAIGAISLAIVAGVASTAVQADRARENAAAAERQTARANVERAAADQVSTFLIGLFRSADPARQQHGEPTVREVLDRATDALEEQELPDHVRAELLFTVADVYNQLRLFERVLEPAMAALEIRERADPPNAEQTSDLLILLSLTELSLNRPDNVRARLERADELLPDHKNNRLHQAWGFYYLRRGMYDEAGAALTRSLELTEAEDGPHSPLLISDLSNLARLEKVRENFDKAEAYLNRGLDVLDNDRSHPSVLGVLSEMTDLYRLQGDYERALALSEEVVEATDAVLGAHSPQAFAARQEVVRVLMHLERHAEGEVILKSIMEDEAATLMIRDETAKDLATIAYHLGRPEEAERLMRDLLAEYDNVETPAAMAAQTILGRALTKMGRHEEVEAIARDMLKKQERRLGMDHPELALLLVDIGGFHVKRKEYLEAGKTYDRAAACLANGPRQSDAIKVLHMAGHQYVEANALDLAMDRFTETIGAQDQVESQNDRRIMLQDFVKLLRLLGKTAEADARQVEVDALKAKIAASPG